MNVDAESLSEKQTAALDEAVRTLGCGLAVFGGDSSYALGGYRGSALEKMLPVTIDVRNRLDLPSTALVLVLDKSGSMADSACTPDVQVFTESYPPRLNMLLKFITSACLAKATIMFTK